MKLFAASLLCVPALVFASPATDLVEKLRGLQSIEGRFEQTILNQDGGRLQEASGTMLLTRGNRFHWHTQEPFEQIAVSDGTTLWVYDVDLEQVIEKPMGERIANTPALLFGGDPQQVTEAFSVEEADRSSRGVTYRLKPLSDDPLFEVLEVTFSGNQPEMMRLEDALGQQTAIQFLDVTLNGKVDASRFSFVAPEGADVIRQSE